MTEKEQKREAPKPASVSSEAAPHRAREQVFPKPGSRTESSGAPCLAASGVEPGWTGQRAAKERLAEEFFQKSGRGESFKTQKRGIDLDADVRVRIVQPGEKLVQYREKGKTQPGNWYADVGADINKVGIRHGGEFDHLGARDRVVLEATRQVAMLETRGKDIPPFDVERKIKMPDDGNPLAEAHARGCRRLYQPLDDKDRSHGYKGGEKQLFCTESDAFKKVDK